MKNHVLVQMISVSYLQNSIPDSEDINIEKSHLYN